uniref:Uncharacterized protein n=1 Tax=Arundo donax TaxID=35708 RepID=A0A0A9BJ15_ARUDO
MAAKNKGRGLASNPTHQHHPIPRHPKKPPPTR